MINCVIIDDESGALETLSDLLKNIPEICLLKAFTDPVEALSYLKDTEDIDLTFIDVDMPVLNGISLSELIRNRTKKLVFTTSHAKYALNAFKVRADDFLLKPFGLADLLSTLDHIIPQSPLKTTFPTSVQDFLYIKNKEDNLKLVKVEYDEIVAIESLLNYSRIHTMKNKLVTHISLKDAKEALKSREEFVQLHRSFIISKKHISEVNGNTITMDSGAKFTVGESYREIMQSFLAERIFKPVQRK